MPPLQQINAVQKLLFRHDRSPVDWEYNPEILGIPQIDNIDQETLLLFTSHTDKSCLRDLLSCKCLVGEVEVLVQNRLGI
ncbi:hypothetical protein P5673_033046 [Acropora cervicornis]|uniref:Uncharacterized protein n=1 Tax=Acropora cervicornis TaxID=6130 RepID=A0AAD9PQU6_ACRCE|nr:hypothetical protein P5673_033046 [Acropora cervicornis]